MILKLGYIGLNCGKCAPGYEPDMRYQNRCKLSTFFYRNSTFNKQFPNIPSDASQTIVTSTNARLRIDPNHLSQIVQMGETVLLR